MLSTERNIVKPRSFTTCKQAGLAYHRMDERDLLAQGGR